MTREGQEEGKGEDDVETREQWDKRMTGGDGAARDKNYDDVENMGCDGNKVKYQGRELGRGRERWRELG